MDLGGCTAAELTDAMGQLHGIMGLAQRRLLTMIAEYDRREGWRVDGAMSMDAWLVAYLGVSRSTASQWVEAAHRLEELPAIGETFEDGLLSWDQVRALCRFATPETDRALAEDAVGRSAAELQAAARRSRPVDEAEARTTHDRRSLRMWWDAEQQMLHLRGELAGADGAKVEKAIGLLADQVPKDPEAGVRPPADARNADALTELAGHALADQRDPDRATVVLHADLTPGTCEIEQGPLLSAEAARRLGCDARVQMVFHNRSTDGVGTEPVGVGRMQRTVPPWLGRLLRRRDTTCRFPGCSRKGSLHAHHIVHWTSGGPTDAGNLVLLCAFHHHFLHERHWTIDGDPNGDIRFRRPDGRPYGTGPPRRRVLRQ